MLVLTGIELIFLIAASMGLYFGLLLEKVLVKQGCFSYCCTGLAPSQSLSCLSTHPNSKQVGGAQRFREEH